MFFGQQPLRVIAQVGWAFILGIAVAWFYEAGGSVWPVALFHGGLDAVVTVNRMGMHIQITPLKGLVMIAASLPVLAYAWWVFDRKSRTGGVIKS
jgi:membrane protease YdiL (CAAX protease family)